MGCSDCFEFACELAVWIRLACYYWIAHTDYVITTDQWWFKGCCFFSESLLCQAVSNSWDKLCFGLVLFYIIVVRSLFLLRAFRAWSILGLLALGHFRAFFFFFFFFFTWFSEPFKVHNWLLCWTESLFFIIFKTKKNKSCTLSTLQMYQNINWSCCFKIGLSELFAW